jgi:hypothetical protein
MKNAEVMLWVLSLGMAAMTAETLNIVFVLSIVTLVITSIRLKDGRNNGDVSEEQSDICTRRHS